MRRETVLSVRYFSLSAYFGNGSAIIRSVRLAESRWKECSIKHRIARYLSGSRMSEKMQGFSPPEIYCETERIQPIQCLNQNDSIVGNQRFESNIKLKYQQKQTLLLVRKSGLCREVAAGAGQGDVALRQPP